MHPAFGIPNVFQSTLPVWGATAGYMCRGNLEGISIHAPRVGSDLVIMFKGGD